jgi:hypothetical protein
MGHAFKKNPWDGKAREEICPARAGNGQAASAKAKGANAPMPNRRSIISYNQLGTNRILATSRRLAVRESPFYCDSLLHQPVRESQIFFAPCGPGAA